MSLDSFTPDPIYGCHLWTGNTDQRGYGWLWVGKNKRAWAHRAAYEASKGPIPPGAELDHICRVRSCVRPEHLEAVSRRENVKRISWAHRAQQEKCPAGHSLFDHGRRTPTGGQVCLKCAPI